MQIIKRAAGVIPCAHGPRRVTQSRTGCSWASSSLPFLVRGFLMANSTSLAGLFKFLFLQGFCFIQFVFQAYKVYMSVNSSCVSFSCATVFF